MSTGEEDFVKFITEMADDYGRDNVKCLAEYGLSLSKKDKPLSTRFTGFPESAFVGVFKDIRDIYSQTTESPDCYLFGVMLTVIGSLIGRRVYIHAGGKTKLYPNFYVLLLGRSALERKTTAQRIGVELLRRLGKEEYLLLGGLASAEGLLDSFPKDAIFNTLSVWQDEFTELMLKANTDGSKYIKERIAKLYDCPSLLNYPIRNRGKPPAPVSNPFMTFTTGTTLDGIEKTISDYDIYGGFLNRFLIIYGESEKSMSVPPEPNSHDENRLITELKRIEAFWDDKARVGGGEIDTKLDPDAQKIFDDYYSIWRGKQIVNHAGTELTRRFPDMIKKLAMIYLIIEAKKAFITPEHLKPAIEVMEHTETLIDRVTGVFGKSNLGKIEQKIVEFIGEKGTASKREIHHKVSGRIDASTLTRTLSSLESLGVIFFDYQDNKYKKREGMISWS